MVRLDCSPLYISIHTCTYPYIPAHSAFCIVYRGVAHLDLMEAVSSGFQFLRMAMSYWLKWRNQSNSSVSQLLSFHWIVHLDIIFVVQHHTSLTLTVLLLEGINKKCVFSFKWCDEENDWESQSSFFLYLQCVGEAGFRTHVYEY